MIERFARKGQISAVNNRFLLASSGATSVLAPAHYASDAAACIGLFRNLTEIFAKLAISERLRLVMDVLLASISEESAQRPEWVDLREGGTNGMWYSPSLQQLRFLQAVLEEGNFVRAANRLHTTHSTISRSLKALGSELGVDLFDKTQRGLQPNAVGRVYGLEIGKSLDQAKRAFELAQYEANQSTLPFSVGHSPYIHSQLLPLLNALNLPGVQVPSIYLKSAPTTQLVRRVLSGDLRAGFGVLPIVDKDLWVERVAQEPFSACIGERHSLAKATRLAARELRNDTLFWIPRDAHHRFYDHIVGYLRTLELDSQRFQEVRTVTQAVDFVAYGAGVALVPRSAARFQRAGVVFKPITDQLMRIETALFVRRDQMHSAVQDFVEITLSKISALKLMPL